MKTFSVFLIMLFSLHPARSQDRTKKPLDAVPSVDLSKYAGTWYEIARLPNRFQEKCASDVTASYTLLDNGEIRVVNRCRTYDGDTTEAEGLARRADGDEPASKLKVRFAPGILAFLPFVWGDYWIIDLATDYSYAVIGEPNREYLWILSRTPQMEDTTYHAIAGRLREQGYDPAKLVRTVQSR
ncbi:MAG TPA: lipocalin family protein [Bacteroidota bacterium]|nr:lipocalin family protein [Bacteroidota bacterium]